MSPAARERLNWFALIGVASIFSAGTAWGITTIRLGNLETKMEHVARRVDLLYCNSLPVPEQAKCKEQLAP